MKDENNALVRYSVIMTGFVLVFVCASWSDCFGPVSAYRFVEKTFSVKTAPEPASAFRGLLPVAQFVSSVPKKPESVATTTPKILPPKIQRK